MRADTLELSQEFSFYLSSAVKVKYTNTEHFLMFLDKDADRIYGFGTCKDDKNPKKKKFPRLKNKNKIHLKVSAVASALSSFLLRLFLLRVVGRLFPILISQKNFKQKIMKNFINFTNLIFNSTASDQNHSSIRIKLIKFIAK